MAILVALLLIWPGYAAWFRIYTASQHDAVIEATLRKIFVRGASQPLYLKVGDADPSDSLISRLRDLPAPIRKASQGSLKNVSPPLKDAWSYAYVDNATGERGACVQVTGIQFNRFDEAEVEVSFIPFGQLFTLTKTRQGWVVSREQGTWIS
jgi:hypothetical protein